MADVLWRDTALTPKIFILDARAVFPLALWLFHWAWWTAGLALAAIVALYLVQRTGMTPIACFRAIRVACMGRRRETPGLQAENLQFVRHGAKEYTEGIAPCRADRRRGRKKPPRLCRGGLRVCWIQAQASFALAISVRAVNAALSLTASSASILRLISTPAFFRPFMKVE